MLERDGHEVALVTNGREALDAVASRAVDIVMTDVFMPEMDGIELIRAMRRSRPGLPVIAMSGTSSSDRVDYLGAAKLLGASHLLRKPFSLEELRAALATVGAAQRQP